MAMFTIPIYHDYGKVGVGGQLWSVDIPTTNSKGLPIDSAIAIAFTLEQIDIVHNMCEIYSDTFELIDKADDILDIFHKRGKIASLLGIEGGHQSTYL